MMNSDAPLDYAVFQLSPRWSRCELFASANGNTEKLTSGFLKPFIEHLKLTEHDVERASSSIKLEVEKSMNGNSWFNKGTVDRFILFVSTPEVLELANSYDSEMSQLEGARRMYSQGSGDPLSGTLGEGNTNPATADITKTELLRAIDVRLVTLKQDLAIACARAWSAGFSIENVTELHTFAEYFGANRLSEACNNFISLSQRHPDLIDHKLRQSQSLPLCLRSLSDASIRSSSSSDISLDEPELEHNCDSGQINSDFQLHEASFSKPSQLNTTDLSGISKQANPLQEHLEMAVSEEPVPPASSPKSLAEQDRASSRNCDSEQVNSGIELHKASFSKPSQLNTADLSGISKQANPLQEHFEMIVSEEPIPPASSPKSLAGQDRASSRRFSVQDRINLFESKQKEQSAGSKNISTVNVVNTVVQVKGTNRRLSSDSSEKFVLRRRSGSSGMSIDLSSSSSRSSAYQSEVGSAVGTPTSANLQLPSESKTEETTGLKDIEESKCWLDTKEFTVLTSSCSLLPESQCKDFPRNGDCTMQEGIKFCITKAKTTSEKDLGFYELSTSTDSQLNDQDVSRMYQKGFSETSNNTGSIGFTANCMHLKAEDHLQIEGQSTLPDVSTTASPVNEQVRWRGQEALQHQNWEILSPTSCAQVKNQSEGANLFWPFGRRIDSELKAKGSFHSQADYKSSADLSSEGDTVTSQSQSHTCPAKVDGARERNHVVTCAAFGSSLVKKMMNVDHQGLNFRQSSAAEKSVDELEQNKIKLSASDEAVYTKTNCLGTFPAKKAEEMLDIIEPPSARSIKQLQVVSLSKGNQELKDELAKKANELEKLFAAHKLRTFSEQITSSRRSNPVENQEDHVPMATEDRYAGEIPDQLPLKNTLSETPNVEADFDSNFPLKMVDTEEYASTMNKNLNTLSPFNYSRGGLYYKYMHKRNAKLQEEWGTMRLQKEEKMKAMHHSLEHSLAMVKSKYSGSPDRHSSRNNQSRCEILKSFSNSSALRSKQKAIVSVQKDGDRKNHGQDTTYNVPFGDHSPISTASLMLLATGSLTSSTPSTLLASLPKPTLQSTKSVPVKHRIQAENSPAESFVNYSNFRKENAKPSAANTRVDIQEKTKVFSRSKSFFDEANLVKEDKPRRSQSMRKTLGDTGELKDISHLHTDSIDLTPLGSCKAQKDANFIHKVQKSGEFKSFLRKGKGAGIGANIPNIKNYKVFDTNKNGEDSKVISNREGTPELEMERLLAEVDAEAANCPVGSYSEKQQYNQEYENSSDFISENYDKISLSQADSLKLGPSSGLRDESLMEIPGTWNSHLHHAFAYTHEASDIDVSLDSPVGCLASLNLNSNQMEADAVRMRKKWETAQMPIIVANACHQPCKDVTKGFKRILNFGGKSRGSESLFTDWASASLASEIDDDTEDSHDLAAQPTNDMRKLRMGYYLPLGEVKEEAQLLRSSIPNPPANFKLTEAHITGSSLKASRSFFHLSSFRSKESKPR